MIDIDNEKCREYSSLLKDECRGYLKELQEDCLKERFHRETTKDRGEGPYHRDYTRIMYSSSFRRLQGKMQLLGVKNSGFFRNRLTHSLEVAQIARSIANEIGYSPVESFVVGAGALAHDIGNPPFGHAGERYLNEVYRDVGGFEGNAQTLRILTSIERKKPDYRGLNLTPRTLLSCIKYFAEVEDSCYNSKSKFIYKEDYNFMSAFINDNGIKIRTLDVQVVDIADEIAYAAHDLEDGLRVKAFTIDEILQEFWNRSRHAKPEKKLCKESFELFETIVNDARKTAGYKNDDVDITSSEYLQIFGKELASKIINTAIIGIRMMDVDKQAKEKTQTQRAKELGFYEDKVRDLIKGLKDIIFECINHTSEVYHYEQEGKKVIEFLSDFYTNNEDKYLPPEYRASRWKDCGMPKIQKRLTCDYIAGMMDTYAIELYTKYSGKKFAN
ncbi:dGTP triphosphohydrolase [Anaerotignum sp.]|uniref:deoxyguanosinetriphosphate triphosphohydrolase family protein n=1 Tax=Anaerotignum sp. TaxID=2039241 RepID=UPI00332A5799